MDSETSSDDAEKSKPHPDIFKAALSRLNAIQPADVVVVGDTPYDAESAGKAGLRTVGVLCGGFPEHRLREAGCIAIYRNPADLLQHYERSPLRVPAKDVPGQDLDSRRREILEPAGLLRPGGNDPLSGRANRLVEAEAWGGYRTEFYPTYDYRALYAQLQEKMK